MLLIPYLLFSIIGLWWEGHIRGFYFITAKFNT